MSNAIQDISNMKEGATTVAMHNVKPMADNEEVIVMEKGEQQRKKLIKAGLLLTLAAVVTYVVLDYTVRTKQ